MKHVLIGTAAALACAGALAGAAGAQDAPPAGDYTLDKNHASVTWRVNHLGTSNYVARFDEFDAALSFDPAAPETSTLSVTIDVTSLSLDFTNGDAFYDELMGNDGDERFFRAAEFPTVTFDASGIDVTGENTGTVTGDLTFMGQTRPLTLDVTFNGARADFGGGPPVIGFSGTTTVKRSEWGMDALVPILGDDVEVWLEAEFIAPAE